MARWLVDWFRDDLNLYKSNLISWTLCTLFPNVLDFYTFFIYFKKHTKSPSILRCVGNGGAIDLGRAMSSVKSGGTDFSTNSSKDKHPCPKRAVSDGCAVGVGCLVMVHENVVDVIGDGDIF